jgi:hypothetical protein
LAAPSLSDAIILGAATLLFWLGLAILNLVYALASRRSAPPNRCTNDFA